MTTLIPLMLALGAPTTLDSLDTIAPWQAKASDGIAARATSVAGHDGKALRLDWDFDSVAGYAFVRRDLPLTLPDNYAISFWVRWTGGTNNLEFKLVDASGDNVWWVSKPDIALKPGWQQITVPKRDIAFAWGPTKDKVLREAASIEFVVSRGRDGGQGSLDIDDIRLTPLPAVATALPKPTAAARDGNPSLAIDGNRGTVWAGTGPITLDFGGAKEFGGVILQWQGTVPDYAVETSNDGHTWIVRHRVAGGEGGEEPIALPETEARYLRISSQRPARLSEIEIMPLAFGATPNAFIAEVAKRAPRGAYPRGFGEQSYWALVGIDGGADSGLMSEDGAIEVVKGGFSIEPFVVTGGRRFSWADVRAIQSLAENYLPIPSVTWIAPGWTLKTTSFADASVPKGRMMARFTLTNTGTVTLKTKIVIAVRPFQVNPPAQFLSQAGGVSSISAIDWRDGRLNVTGKDDRRAMVLPVQKPERVVTRSFDAGGAIDRLDHETGSTAADTTGLASAALVYPVTVPPGGSTHIMIAMPFPGAPTTPMTAAVFDTAERETVAYWRERLNRVSITVPPDKAALADTLRSSLAHILMSRDGPILRPGTRSYARSWIRDGAMISEGLLRLGQTNVAADYADWYSKHLFSSGKVPCCVDFKGADPVPENDSHGEYIFLLADLYRFGGDKAALARHWPAILGAERYMETLRATTQSDAPWLRGLMPPSISHEGYSAKPQYSLWDDFWALRGYKDAAFVAEVLGKPEAGAIAQHRDQFEADMLAAIASAANRWKIGFIPGATSLGDFDATSTTIALSPGGVQAKLDPKLLAGTFDRYWNEFRARADGTKQWQDYTPYELRSVSAMIRLGHRERVDPLLDFFFTDRRPAAWNQWAEVVGRKPREIRFIGDMPHAWISSDFIRSMLDMFAYQRFEDDALVLGAGLSEAWLSNGGSAVKGLRTPYGTLDFAIHADTRRMTVTIDGTARPPGGFVLPWPLAGRPGTATVDGKSALWRNRALLIAPTGRPIMIEMKRP